MNGERKIEIFAPFGEAYELTKKILFQPFDFKKWCVIGFAAFLTYLNGGFTGFRFPGGNNWMNHVSVDKEGFHSFMNHLGPVWLGLIAVAGMVMIAIFITLTWVRARGHFVFIDCIVRNRAAIVEPWNEFRNEGNNYFVFILLVTFAILGLILTALAIIFATLVISRLDHGGLAFLPLLLLVIILPAAFAFMTIAQFVAPLMYRRRCTAWPAFADLVSLLGKHLGLFVLYFLFLIVIGLAVAILVVAATCMTCCIAALPYVGTVMLLPIFVFMQSFTLLFLRQFGPEYDVWSKVTPPEIPPTTSTLPPPPLPA